MKFYLFIIFLAAGIGSSCALIIDEFAKTFSSKTANKLLLILTSGVVSAFIAIFIMKTAF